MSAYKNDDDKWKFDFIECELLPRITKPDYSNCTTDDDKKYVTWITAKKDISINRERGYRGRKYKLIPILYNSNKGKFHSEKVLWNNSFGRVVPEKWKTSSCEYKTIRRPVKANWKYSIKSIKKL